MTYIVFLLKSLRLQKQSIFSPYKFLYFEWFVHISSLGDLCGYVPIAVFFFHSSCSSLYTYHGNKEETVFKNQNVLSVVNMSFLLMTFMLNLTVTCLGEVRFW